MEDSEKKIVELKIINGVKDSTISGLSNLIVKLTTKIEKYYISRKEHERIIRELKGE